MPGLSRLSPDRDDHHIYKERDVRSSLKQIKNAGSGYPKTQKTTSMDSNGNVRHFPGDGVRAAQEYWSVSLVALERPN